MRNRPLLTLLKTHQAPNYANTPPTLGDDCLEALSRFHETPIEELTHLNSSYLIRDNDYRLLEVLDTLPTQTHADDALKTLTKVIRLTRNAAGSVRLPAFRKFNSYLSILAKRHAKSRRLFDACAEMVITFRALMDAVKQENPGIAKLEWVELEKSVYQLSLWEELLEAVETHPSH
jgi:hypothetical protein